MADFFGRLAKKRTGSPNIISLLISIIIVTFLMFSGPAGAVDLSFDVSGDGGNNIFEEDEDETIAEFNFEIDVEDAEHVPFYNFTLEITGPYNLTCNFTIDGDNDCDDISISYDLAGIDNYSDGFGYGYGSSDGGEPFDYANTSFGYGYGRTSTGIIEYKYSIRWNLEDAGIITDDDYDGIYTARVYARTQGISDEFVYVSDQVEFETQADTGGGGSSSGAAPIVIPAIPVSSNYWTSLDAGDRTTVNIYGSAAVNTISFIVALDIDNVQVKLNDIENSSVTSVNDIDQVYDYFEIEHTLDDDDISQAEIGFEVDINWLEEAGLNAEQIVLYRYNTYSREWEALETRIVEEDGLVVRFVAISPGFSCFAIGFIMAASGDSQEIHAVTHPAVTQPDTGFEQLPEQPDKPKPQEKSQTAHPPTKISQTAKDVPGLNPESKEKFNVLWVWAIIIFGLVAAAILIYALAGKRKGVKSSHNKDEKVKEVNDILTNVSEDQYAEIDSLMQDLRLAFRDRDVLKFQALFEKFKSLYKNIGDSLRKKQYYDSVTGMLKILSEEK